METKLQLRPLSQLERASALRKAKAAVVESFGDEPQLSTFLTKEIQLTATDVIIWIMSGIALLAAFYLSAVRLFDIGRSTFLESIAHPLSADGAGVAIVVLAEITQVISAIAKMKATDDHERRLLTVVGLGAMTLALVGNTQVVRPWEREHVDFAWLEAIFPPFVVLVVSNIIKNQLLGSLLARQEAYRKYEQAFEKWQRDITSDPTTHPHWHRFYANALRDELTIPYKRSKAGRELINSLSNRDWTLMVWREMAADQWFDPTQQREEIVVETEPRRHEKSLPETHNSDIHQLAQPARREPSGGLIDRAMATAIFENEVYKTKCPLCDKEFENASDKSLRRAVSAHIGRFCPNRDKEIQS